MNRIAITGVAGFIGSNLAEALLRRGDAVIGIDNLSQGSLENLRDFERHPNFELHQVNVQDREAVGPLIGRADAVVHLAAYKIPRYSDALDTLQINVKGTANVLEAALARSLRVVFASTSDVYGKNPSVPFSEISDLYFGAPTVRRWSYAVSKWVDEHLALAYWREHGLPVVGVRLFGGYGPRQNMTWWGGPQSVFIGAALRGEQMDIHGTGLQTRSFTFVSDHVDGFLRCLDSPDAPGHIFNIGNDREITIRGLAEMIWRLIRDDEPRLNVIPYESFGKYEDVIRRSPDLELARSVLGFSPAVSLEEGLPVTIAWQRGRMS